MPWRRGALTALLVGATTFVGLPGAVGATSRGAEAVTGAATDAPMAGTAGVLFHNLAPARILDSRAESAIGSFTTPWGAGETRDVLVVDGAMVPQEAKAVTLNVTVTSTTATSHLSIWPAGGDKPLVSSLNWEAGTTIPNHVTVPIGDDGEVSVFNASGTADVIFDVTGFYRMDFGSGYTPVEPERILDSRPPATGPFSTPWPANGTRDVVVRDGSLVPPDAAAVVINVTSANSTADSFLSIWPAGGDQPEVSSLNWRAGTTIANLVTVGIGTDGEVSVFNPSGTTDVIIDLVGYYRAAGGLAFHPTDPTRISDSRPAPETVGAYATPWGPDTTRTVAIAGGATGVPVEAEAVVLNVTATNTTAASFLSVNPTGDEPAEVSSLNWPVGTTIPNAVTAKTGTAGSIDVFNPSGDVDVVVDASGWFAASDQTIDFTTEFLGATVGGPTYQPTAAATSGLSVTITVAAASSTVCTKAGSVVSFVGIGTCTLNADQGGGPGYRAAPQVQQSIEVTSAHFVATDGDSVYVSKDNGANWVSATTQPEPTAPLNAMAGRGRDYVAGGNDGKVYVSADFGMTWAAATTQPTTTFPIYAMTASGSYFVASDSGGDVFVSSDNGVSWVAATTQPPDSDEFGGLASNGAHVVAVERHGDHEAFVSDDHGMTWAPAATQPQAAGPLHALAASGSTFVTSNFIGQVFVSTDNGVHWAAAATQPTGVLPGSNAIIWSATASGSNFAIANWMNDQIWVSADNGATWAHDTTSPPGAAGIRGMAANGSDFVAVGSAGETYVSGDSGVNWADATTSPPGATNMVTVVHG